MASISKRYTASGEVRYDVRYRAGGDQAAKSYRLLRAILNTAVDDELIARNPCRIRGGAEHADDRPMIDAELVFSLADAITPRLRHDAATLTTRMPGITTKELMARIGTRAAAAFIYQHATEQRDREIAAYLDDAIPEP